MLLFVACSKGNKTKIEEANELINQKKFKESIELLTEVVNSKDENFSPIALRILGQIYQQHSMTEVPYYESQSIAQRYFYQVYEQYPNSEDSPKSLFMSAYLLANELNQFDEAKRQYKLFLEKFPNHELSASAKVELENIGLTPEEILNKNLMKSDAN